MSINATTGLVTWVPNGFPTGSSSVTVVATGQFGDTTQQAFSISVFGAGAPYSSFVSTNRGLVIVGPVLPGSVVRTTSGFTAASLQNDLVDQYFASNGMGLGL